jgi:hypothetical protein
MNIILQGQYHPIIMITVTLYTNLFFLFIVVHFTLNN